MIQLRKLQRDFFVYKWYYKKHLSHSTNQLLIASQTKCCGFQLALSFMSSKGSYAKLNRDTNITVLSSTNVCTPADLVGISASLSKVPK